MDRNDNNNICESVQLELITVKAELKQEPTENVDITEPEVHTTQNLNVTIDNSNDSSVGGQKRKHFEDNSLNVQEDETMSDTSNTSKSTVKRRRFSDFQNEESVANSEPALPEPNTQEMEESRPFTLLVTNSPGDWTSQEVIDYIKEQCGIHISKINDSRESNSDADCQIKLKFTNKAQLNRVLLQLKGKEVEGKLMVQIEDSHNDSQSDAESETMVHIDERAVGDPSSVLTQVIESDENPYHLKTDYLESLGIKLPLTNWVTVTNFRCDKTELKEVLELCGKVLVCTVVVVNTKYANVMYSHPLEAVQAISMLNGQKLYGKPLKLTMNNAVDMKTLLPKGLQDLGPGLGKLGKPLPDLVDQYKNFLEGKTSEIDGHVFQQDWVNKLGVALEECSYVRPVNNSLSNDDSVSEQSRESSPSARSGHANQFGPIGQRPPRPRSTPINRPQFHNNPITNFNNQPVVRTSSQIVARGGNATIAGPMQGTRAPIPNIVFQSCPPIPGVETNDPRSFHNGVRPGPMSGPIGHNNPVGPRPLGPMIGPSPRIPIPANNRFAGPMSPMLGSRPVGPGSMGPMSHSAPIGPVLQVGQIRQMRPIGQVGQMGQVGQVGQVSHVGQVGQLGQISQAGQIGPGQAGIVLQVGPSGQVGQVGPVPGPVSQGFQICPRPGSNGPMPSQSVAGHNIRPVMPSMSYMTQAGTSGCSVQMYKGNDPVTLQISNLPPTTNFVNLGQKLAELGHVVFLEFTTPGCAVVRFANPADAERCFQKIIGKYLDEIHSQPVDLQ